MGLAASGAGHHPGRRHQGQALCPAPSKIMATSRGQVGGQVSTSRFRPTKSSRIVAGSTRCSPITPAGRSNRSRKNGSDRYFTAQEPKEFAWWTMCSSNWRMRKGQEVSPRSQALPGTHRPGGSASRGRARGSGFQQSLEPGWLAKAAASLIPQSPCPRKPIISGAGACLEIFAMRPWYLTWLNAGPEERVFDIYSRLLKDRSSFCKGW